MKPKEPIEIRILEQDEIARILAAAKGTGYYDLYFLALYSGMRRLELLGLLWSDVDLVLGQISVSRILCRLRDGSIDTRPPMTARSKRLIALSPDASLILQDYRKRQEALFSGLGRPLKNYDYVFADESGGNLLPDRVTRSWVKLMHRLGVPNAPFHCLRHTHASLMLQAGVHPKTVQERLGHSSIPITLDYYSHIAPEL